MDLQSNDHSKRSTTHATFTHSHSYRTMDLQTHDLQVSKPIWLMVADYQSDCAPCTT